MSDQPPTNKIAHMRFDTFDPSAPEEMQDKQRRDFADTWYEAMLAGVTVGRYPPAETFGSMMVRIISEFARNTSVEEARTMLDALRGGLDTIEAHQQAMKTGRMN